MTVRQVAPLGLFNLLTGRTIFAALLLLTLPALAGTNSTPTPPADGARMDSITVSTAFLEKVKETYRSKCGPQYINCYLTEADIEAQGSSNQILIFRGEPHAFKSPITSSLFRWMESNPEILAKIDDYAGLSKTAYSYMRNNLGPKNFFDSKTRIFDNAVSAPRPKLRVLASNHLSLEGLKIVNPPLNSTAQPNELCSELEVATRR